jgi:hypothetical protein
MVLRNLQKTGGLWLLASLALSVILVPLAASTAMPSPMQVAGVEGTRMGAYKALAELTFRAFQKGDKATAAKLARILERTWDHGEEGCGDSSLSKTNVELFGQIDQAMDTFIKPILAYETKPPDPAAVESAYNQYLAKLNLGN